MIPSHPSAPVQLTIAHLASNAEYNIEVHRTGFHANDAYSAYLEMGSPRELSAAQLAHLQELTRDLQEKQQTVRSTKMGVLDLANPMNSNDIVLVKISPAQ